MMKAKTIATLSIAVLFAFAGFAIAAEKQTINLQTAAITAVNCPNNHLALFKRTAIHSLDVECKALEMNVPCTKHIAPTEIVNDWDQGGSEVIQTFIGTLVSPLGKEEFIGYRNDMDEVSKRLNARAQELVVLGICKKFTTTIEE